jgi:hypothetical protein
VNENPLYSLPVIRAKVPEAPDEQVRRPHAPHCEQYEPVFVGATLCSRRAIMVYKGTVVVGVTSAVLSHSFKSSVIRDGYRFLQAFSTA